MIVNDEIIEIGQITKPHGINGQVVITIESDVNLGDLFCVIIKDEGLNVPYFINSIRTKGYNSAIVSIDDVATEDDALTLCGKPIYALKRDLDIEDSEIEEDGFYAVDLIGYSVVENNILLGEITEINDATENALFIVTSDNGNVYYIPIADEYIIDINAETKTIIMDLPIGLIDL